MIRPANHPLNTVSIIAKTNNPDGGGPLNWLNGVNKTRDNIIRLQVPDADQLREYYYNLDDESCYFDYAIYVKGKIPVDPRVTVRK